MLFSIDLRQYRDDRPSIKLNPLQATADCVDMLIHERRAHQHGHGELVDDVELGLVKPITKPKSHQNGCADVETLAVSVSQARPFVLILIHLEFLPAAGEKLRGG